jgi:hypothetical protein
MSGQQVADHLAAEEVAPWDDYDSRQTGRFTRAFDLYQRTLRSQVGGRVCALWEVSAEGPGGVAWVHWNRAAGPGALRSAALLRAPPPLPLSRQPFPRRTRSTLTTCWA